MDILIVEDQDDVARHIQEILGVIRTKCPDATITVATTFSSAARYLATMPNPDIIFLDLQLPDMGWRNTLSRINLFETEKSKVIIITGYPPELVRENLSQYPDIEILHKGEGFFDKLLGAIFRALQRNKGGRLEQVAENIRKMRELTAPHASSE